MKTAKFILAAFVLSFTIISCQKENIVPQSPVSSQDLKGQPVKKGENSKKENPDEITGVNYAITVHFPLGRELRSTYEVEIVNANEQLVAPRQIFVPGTSVYNFFEQAKQESGIRIARLVPVKYPDEHFLSAPELSTTQEIKIIDFLEGESYSFDLWPKFTTPDPTLTQSTIKD